MSIFEKKIKFDVKMAGMVGQDLSFYLTLSFWRIGTCLTLKVQKYGLLRKIIESLATMSLLKRSFTHIKLPFKMFVSILTYLSNKSNDKMENHLYKP